MYLKIAGIMLFIHNRTHMGLLSIGRIIKYRTAENERVHLNHHFQLQVMKCMKQEHLDLLLLMMINCEK